MTRWKRQIVISKGGLLYCTYKYMSTYTYIWILPPPAKTPLKTCEQMWQPCRWCRRFMTLWIRLLTMVVGFSTRPRPLPPILASESRWAGMVANKTKTYEKRKESIMIKEKKREKNIKKKRGPITVLTSSNLLLCIPAPGPSFGRSSLGPSHAPVETPLQSSSDAYRSR